jgi:hypothetical protein
MPANGARTARLIGRFGWLARSVLDQPRPIVAMVGDIIGTTLSKPGCGGIVRSVLLDVGHRDPKWRLGAARRLTHHDPIS